MCQARRGHAPRSAQGAQLRELANGRRLFQQGTGGRGAPTHQVPRPGYGVPPRSLQERLAVQSDGTLQVLRIALGFELNRSQAVRSKFMQRMAMGFQCLRERYPADDLAEAPGSGGKYDSIGIL